MIKRHQTLSRTPNRKSGFAAIEILVVIAVVLILVLGGYYIFQKKPSGQDHLVSNSPITPRSTNISPNIVPSASRYWIMSSYALNQVVTSAQAKNSLAGDTIFVTMKTASQLVPQTNGLKLIKAEAFTSEATLAQAITSNSIITGAKAILYDNEPWVLTPANEQANPSFYYQAAAALAHSHGYLLIGTPVSKTDPEVDAQIAPYVDILDIQSQYDQAVATIYSSHVLPIASSVRASNNKVIILSGLSTNPPAGIPTVNQLLSDAQSVKALVQGYWLNIPSPGISCPNCHEPQPQIGIQFLASLGPS